MAEITDLADKIEKKLPIELVGLIKSAGSLAAANGEELYLVGGAVRDLLLGKANLDIDLVVEGDAIALARRLLEGRPGKLTIHQRFNTAKLQWHRWSIDLATARSETYAHPGALPTVKPGSVADDLLRRDFTINAMAVELTPAGYGRLIDLYGGQNDISSKLIRILHQKSFTDDATRMWRGLRYEQRLGFQLEADSLRLLERDIDMLDSISGDRIRYELECVLGEQYPEKALMRAEELGVLAKLSPALKGNSLLAERFTKARRLSSSGPPPAGIYMALFTYPLTAQQVEQLVSYLRLPKLLARTLRDTAAIRAKLHQLADPGLRPSAVYHLLDGYSPQALTANLLAGDSPQAGRHIRQYRDKLRHIKPKLAGNDLMKLGLAPGPQLKELLNRLLDARLDREVTSKQGEERLVREWLDNRGQSSPNPPA
jgi:tRNA nucleotidyltransferase (CCA-adding enzyme)